MAWPPPLPPPSRETMFKESGVLDGYNSSFRFLTFGPRLSMILAPRVTLTKRLGDSLAYLAQRNGAAYLHEAAS